MLNEVAYIVGKVKGWLDENNFVLSQVTEHEVTFTSFLLGDMEVTGTLDISERDTYTFEEHRPVVREVRVYAFLDDVPDKPVAEWTCPREDATREELLAALWAMSTAHMNMPKSWVGRALRWVRGDAPEDVEAREALEAMLSLAC